MCTGGLASSGQETRQVTDSQVKRDSLTYSVRWSGVGLLLFELTPRCVDANPCVQLPFRKRALVSALPGTRAQKFKNQGRVGEPFVKFYSGYIPLSFAKPDNELSINRIEEGNSYEQIKSDTRASLTDSSREYHNTDMARQKLDKFIFGHLVCCSRLYTCRPITPAYNAGTVNAPVHVPGVLNCMRSLTLMRRNWFSRQPREYSIKAQTFIVRFEDIYAKRSKK